MEDLDNEARSILEKNIDAILKEPKEAEMAFTSILRKQGVEPNLETLLGYLIGYISGIIDGFYIHKHKRMPNRDETKELCEILERRAWEIRQAFMGTRVE